MPVRYISYFMENKFDILMKFLRLKLRVVSIQARKKIQIFSDYSNFVVLFTGFTSAFDYGLSLI